ncbi:N-acetylgalactosaminyltransferase 7, partial [Stegodyphus mimosarum]
MKIIGFRKSRTIKICLIILFLILLVAFFIPKPKGKESSNGSVLASKERKLMPVRQGAIFKKGILGNFEHPPSDTIREGPGENGKPHYPRPEDQNEVSQAMMEFGINMVASDQIAMDRSIPDKRLSECKYWHYPKDLPS